MYLSLGSTKWIQRARVRHAPHLSPPGAASSLAASGGWRSESGLHRHAPLLACLGEQLGRRDVEPPAGRGALGVDRKKWRRLRAAALVGERAAGAEAAADGRRERAP